MGADRLHVKGIRAYGYTGAFPEEQVLGQWFEVNLTLWVNLKIAAQSDRLADTLDYGPLTQAIQRLIQTARFKLVERLAAAIATEALSDPRVDQVQVLLTKLTPPIPNFDGAITVDITRSQGDTHN